MTVFATLLLGSCGDPIHVGADLGDPVATLAARVDGPAPEVLVLGRVRAALLWGTVSSVRLACLEATGNADLCAPLTGFSPAGSSHTLEIDPVFPASFQVPLHTLPPPSLLMADDRGMLGYAELVLFEDGNANDTVDLVSAAASDSVDVVVASAPPSSDEHVWVLYREGELPREWLAFEASGCVPPPIGYSVARIELGAAPVCWIGEPTSVTIPVRFDTSDAVRELICEPRAATSTFPAQPPPPDTIVFCRGRDRLEFVTDPTAYCPHLQRYALSGCDAQLICVQPEWDLSAAPPAWWPCDGLHSGDFTLVNGPSPWSGGPDHLVSIEYTMAGGDLDIAGLVVRLHLNDGEPVELRAPGALIATGGDGLLSTGEMLEVREPPGVERFDSSTVPAQYVVELVTEEASGPNSAGDLAEFLWSP